MVKACILHLLQLSMVNAYILYCYNTPKKERMTHLKFCLAVARVLLEEAQPVPAVRYQRPPAAANVPLRLTGRHFPEPAGGRPDCSDRAVTEQQGTGSRHSGSARHARSLCAYIRVLNATTH